MTLPIEEADGELAHTGLPEGEIMEFKHLSPDEAERFREYARKNDPPAIEDWLIYHPICREVWIERGIDGGKAI
jgi:hypothetical protein